MSFLPWQKQGPRYTVIITCPSCKEPRSVYPQEGICRSCLEKKSGPCQNCLNTMDRLYAELAGGKNDWI